MPRLLIDPLESFSLSGKMDEFIYLNRTRVDNCAPAFFERERETGVVKLIFALDLYSIEISPRAKLLDQQFEPLRLNLISEGPF